MRAALRQTEWNNLFVSAPVPGVSKMVKLSPYADYLLNTFNVTEFPPSDVAKLVLQILFIKVVFPEPTSPKRTQLGDWMLGRLLNFVYAKSCVILSWIELYICFKVF
jgi:hypothetical protein